jgi:hypothetical protein
MPTVRSPGQALVLEDGAYALLLAQLPQDVIDVRLHRRDRDEEITRYLLVRAVLSHQVEYFALSGCEVVQE